MKRVEDGEGGARERHGWPSLRRGEENEWCRVSVASHVIRITALLTGRIQTLYPIQ